MVLTREEAAMKINSAFNHYLHFYEHRAFDGTEHPQPEGLVDFTSAHYPYENLFHYKYVSFKTMAYYINVNRDHVLIDQYITTLSKSEISAICDKYEVDGRIRLGILQEAEISKINKEMKGAEIVLGIDVGADNVPILGEDTKPVPNSLLEDYQQGKTIVIPAQYWSSPDYNRMRMHFNFNNAAVREYCVRVMLSTIDMCKDNAVFVDNVFISIMQMYNDVPFNTQNLYYISGGTAAQQTTLYISQYISIIEEAVSRLAQKPLIITNGWFYGGTPGTYKEAFTNAIRTNLGDIDGVMCENNFLEDKNAVEVQWFIDWVRDAKQAGKKAIFAVAYSSMDGLNDPYIYSAWLWLHLIADDNVYAYMNDAYRFPMKDLYVFRCPLGSPVGAAFQKGTVWQREYEKGTIYFNVSDRKLEDIHFVEKTRVVDIKMKEIREREEEALRNMTEDEPMELRIERDMKIALIKELEAI
jgi:hypothetical protein